MTYPKYNRVPMDQEPDSDAADKWIEEQYELHRVPACPETGIDLEDIPAETIKDYLIGMWDCLDGLSKEEVLAVHIIIDDIKLFHDGVQTRTEK